MTLGGNYQHQESSNSPVNTPLVNWVFVSTPTGTKRHQTLCHNPGKKFTTLLQIDNTYIVNIVDDLNISISGIGWVEVMNLAR